jgi:hypothetical protein
MAAIDELKEWFQRDVKFATWDDNVSVDDADPSRIGISFFTDTNEYLLTILLQGDDPPHIDATVKSRKPRAGQTTSRLRRVLPASRIQLSRRAWRRILGGIVGLELVRVQRGEAAARPDERGEDAAARRDRIAARRAASASAASASAAGG